MARRYLQNASLAALLVGTSLALAGPALADGPISGTLRPLNLNGLTQYNLSGGATLYTGLPSPTEGRVDGLSFSWSTGSSTGSISGIPSPSVNIGQ